MGEPVNPPQPYPYANVLKHGIGYDLVVVEERSRHVGLDPTPMVLVLGIRCHACRAVSFHPTDVTERYCGRCNVFHDANPMGPE